MFEAAVKAVKSHFGEADSVIKKAWLLTELVIYIYIYMVINVVINQKPLVHA